MKKIAFVIVNFEGANYTNKFIRSVYDQHGINEDFSCEVIVVDNSTSTEGVSAIQDVMVEFPEVELIRQEENLGYFSALNFGLEHVFSKVSIYDYVFIGNNDLELESLFCAYLANMSIERNIYAICPDVVTIDGYHQNPHLLSRMGWKQKLKLDIYFSCWPVASVLRKVKTLIGKYLPRQNNYCSTPCRIHMGIGACYILTPGFFDKNRILEFPFFLYGEEAYFSDQIHRAGGELIYRPELVVQHAESASLSKLPSKRTYLFGREGYWSSRNLL